MNTRSGTARAGKESCCWVWGGTLHEASLGNSRSCFCSEASSPHAVSPSAPLYAHSTSHAILIHACPAAIRLTRPASPLLILPSSELPKAAVRKDPHSWFAQTLAW